MPSAATSVYYALVVAWGASFYQFYLRDLFQTTLGLGRVMQPIEDFPFSCRRIEHPQLEACEDLWLDNEARTLYAACAGTDGRLHWNQAIGNLNATGRRAGGAELIALDIDNPGVDGFFSLRTIKPIGYTGANGDASLDLLGFDAEILDGEIINFYFINQRPPIGPFNNYMDASVLGTNETIDVFEMKRGHETMRHLRTVHSPNIFTANRVAIVGNGDFMVTNDHSAKTGLLRELDNFIGGGNIAYCKLNNECHIAVQGNEETTLLSKSAKNQPLYKQYLDQALSLIPKTKLKFPNGLTRGFDGLYYVPSTIDGQVRVYALDSNDILQQIDTIYTGMPLDNISPDARGDLYVAGFPNMLATLKSLVDPRNKNAPATILRIRKTVDAGPDGVRSVDYRVEKVIEDKEGKILTGATTVRHDARTGRLFIGAAVHPFLMVCDPK